MDRQTDEWTDNGDFIVHSVRLFTFIEVTRSRNWKFHLDALEDMKPGFASIDRINYQPLSAVYIADMKPLENNDRATWDYFMEGNICCHKNDIPWPRLLQGTRKQNIERTRSGAQSIKQLKQHKLLLHDSS